MKSFDVKFSWMKLILFTALTLLITWMFWLIPLLSSLEIIDTNLPLNVFQLIGTFVPSIMGIFFVVRQYQENGRKILFKQITFLSFSKFWWIYIFGLVPAIIGISFLVAKQIESSELEFFLGYPAYFIPIFFFVILLQFGPLGEEIGWRGFLLPELMKKFNAFKSSLYLGIIWSVWHLPLFFIEGTIQSSLDFWQFSAFTILMTFLYTFIFIKTSGSIIVAIIFHTMGNLSHSLFPAIFMETGLIIVGILMMLVVLFIVGKNRELFFKEPKEN